MPPRLVLLGSSGWLGVAARSLIEAQAVFEVICPSRGSIEKASPHEMRDLLRPDGDLTVINCVGTARGTDSELHAANVAFVQTLVTALTDQDAYLIHVGSAAEYGNAGSGGPISESTPPAPVTRYGASKEEGSSLVSRRGDWCVFRPFNLIGSTMPPTNPLSELRDKVRTAHATREPVALRCGDTERDHVTVNFVARSLLYAAQEKPAGVFNLCSGLPVSYRDLVMEMASVLGFKASIHDLHIPTGVLSVVGDPTAWHANSGMRERLSVAHLARLAVESVDTQ